MRLTHDQLVAARARGCALLPATEDQVRRLTVQRRIFQVDGLPFVAARDGFFETHGTLAALIEGSRPGVPEQNSEVTAALSPEDAAPNDGGPAPAPARHGTVQAERNGRHATAATKPRKPRAPRPKPAPAETGAPPTGENAAASSEAAEMLAEVEAVQGRGTGARVVGRRRAGKPPTPRWMTAGKARRGRLK